MQGATGAVPLLRDLGAERVFVLAGTIGAGPVPSEDDATVHVMRLEGGPSLMDNIRRFEATLVDLPATAAAALDDFDPSREALVLGSFFTPNIDVAGRRVYGGRPDAWTALENKIVVDEMWDAAGVPRAPTAVVPPGDLADAARSLDRGLGAACAGDAREGWWGGAAYFRWIRTPDDLAEASAFFAEHCDSVRVMPFLDGIPCSIHGVVFPETVIALRPVEMLTLRRPGSNRLLYSGLATYWDPTDADREAMRETARRVGNHLREQVGYRGAFTIDGVMTEEGFLPTELNPRPGAGLAPQTGAAGLNIALLNKLIIEGEDADYRPPDLEELVVSAADAKRGGGCYTIFAGDETQTRYIGVARRDGRYVVLPEGEAGDGMITLGPSGAGGFVRFDPDLSRVSIGESFAPTAVELFAFTDAEFGTGLGPLEAATPAR